MTSNLPAVCLRRFMVAAAVAAGMTLIVSASHGAPASEVASATPVAPGAVAIGFAAPLANPAMQSARDGAQLAVEEANAGGPRAAARQFVLLAQDDRAEPHIARYVGEYFVRSGVVGVVGHYFTDVAVAMAPFYEEHQVAQLMFTASSAKFTANGFASAFRLMGHSQQTARTMVEAIVDVLGARRVAIVADDSNFGQALLDDFSAALARRGGDAQVIYRVTVSNKAPDFHPVLQALPEKRPDLILFSTSSEQALRFVQAASRLDIPVRLMLTGGAINQRLAPLIGARTVLYTLEPESMPGHCAAWQAFNQRFTQRFGRAPTSYSRNAYNATQTLIAAANRSDGNAARVLASLHQQAYKSISGDIAFDSQGNALNVFYTLYRSTAEGEWQAVREFALGKPSTCR